MATGKKNQNSKGNGAAKRMMNPRLKARRKECWERGEAKKKARRDAQEARHKANLAKKNAA